MPPAEQTARRARVFARSRDFAAGVRALTADDQGHARHGGASSRLPEGRISTDRATRYDALPMETKKRKRLPYAELRARKELAERAIDDIRTLMADADPLGAPEDFAERERKALALLEELSALVPAHDPLSDEERARLEEELADKPDNETLRSVLLEMEKLLDDPAITADFDREDSREKIRDALSALDEVALLTPISRATEALAEEMRTPRVPDPKAALLRRETEKQAAKRRS